jgi:hypothetical protein
LPQAFCDSLKYHYFRRRTLERYGDELAGFDHEAVIRAMGSTGNARFVCWQRRV